jgi:nitrogen fixation protein FixH
LFGFIAFFGVIAAVNAVFMYFALSTWPGLTTEDAYKKGIAYNSTLEDADRQKQLGWQSAVIFQLSGNLAVFMTDKTGAPLTSAKVDVTLSRPLGSDVVLSVTLEETAPGRYAGHVEAPAQGRWKAAIDAHRDNAVYRMRHEVMVK